MIIGKAPSSWRRGESQDPKKAAYQSRFQIDNPHADSKSQPTRSASLNPLIYPPWWGEDSAIEMEVAKKKAQTKEDDLDKRMREARDRK